MASLDRINNDFGDIDLELLDLILKGVFPENQKILDVGCGEGRNLIYFFQHHFEVHAIDQEKSAVDLVRYIAKSFQKDPTHINLVNLTDLSVTEGLYDSILCSRVLHFSDSEQMFLESWHRLVELVRTGGVVYFTTDSKIGFERHVKKLEEGKWQFKDGSVRFLLTEQLLDKMEIEAHFESIVPMKTILYEDQHAQTILCLRKL